MKEKIIEELYKKLSTTYKVNFIPLEKFEEDFKVVSHDFLKKIKPIEEEYNRIKKTKVSPVILSKADYIREGFYLDPVLKTFPMLPLPQLKHPKDKRTVSFTPQVLEEIIRNELKKYTDNQLKKQFEESYIKLENQYNEAIKKRVEFGFINPLISYAQKKAPALFKLDGFKQNGNVQKIETVENLFKEYISKLALCKDGFLVGKGKVGALGDKGAKLVGKGKAGNKILFLDKPENILKNFRITYLDDYSKYQQLFRNAERFINMEKADFLIKEYEINIGSVSFHSERGRQYNTYKITRGSKAPFEYIETNNCEKVESNIINIFLLTIKGDLIKLCIYDKGLLNRKEYLIKEIKQVEQIHNSIVRVSPIKHFNPATIVFDTPEKASSFVSKINTSRKGNRDSDSKKY